VVLLIAASDEAEVDHWFAVRPFWGSFEAAKKHVVLDSTPHVQHKIHPFVVPDLADFLFGSYEEGRRNVIKHLIQQYDEFGNEISVFGYSGGENLLNNGGDQTPDGFANDLYMSNYLTMRRPEAPKWNNFCGSKAVYELDSLSIFPDTGSDEV
jgi:hypothetical protein